MARVALVVPAVLRARLAPAGYLGQMPVCMGVLALLMPAVPPGAVELAASPALFPYAHRFACATHPTSR